MQDRKTSELLDALRSEYRGIMLENEPLSNYTWMKVGGPADIFLEPVDKKDLITAVRILRSFRYPYMMLGRGANMIVSDVGYRGAMINIESGMNSFSVQGGKVIAEAGVWIVKFVDLCIQNSLAGVEMLAGIPGTLGGGITMNAGAFGGEISDHIVSIEVLREGSVLNIAKENAGFSYRHSGFANDIILSATFELPKGDKEEISRKRREILIKRNELQPLDLPNSGSMFKNPQGKFAAQLIDQRGLKGASKGAMQVSDKHANFFVNRGGASGKDVLNLLLHVREVVREKTGVILEPEVKLIGFQESDFQEIKEHV